MCHNIENSSKSAKRDRDHAIISTGATASLLFSFHTKLGAFQDKLSLWLACVATHGEF